MPLTLSRLLISVSSPDGASSFGQFAPGQSGQSSASSPVKNAPIIVLGAHRSGTSALAGALSKLGYFPGASLMPPVDGVNNNGFFEDQRVASLNDDVLAELGRDWRWPLPMPEHWLEQDAMQPLRARAQALLKEQAEHPLWQLKDPRMCQTLPLWLAELAKLDVVPNILFIVRDGREVIESLHKRDHMAREWAEAIWLNSMLDAERYSRNLPRLLVPYAQLLEHAKDTLQTITSWLGVHPASTALTQAAEFISQGQRHEQAAELPAPSTHIAQQLNAWVSQPSSYDPTVLDAAATTELMNELAADSIAALNNTRPLINAQAQQVQYWENELETALEQLDAHKEAANSFEENAALSADAARQQYSALEKTVALVGERDAELEALRAQVQNLNSQLATQQNAHQEFRDRATRVLGDQVLPPAQGSEREQSSNDYKGLINLQVENNAHTRVIRYLREHFHNDAIRLLEVGCSEGYFGAAVKADGHEVWGIETNAIAADIAQTKLDVVYRDSIEAFLLAENYLDERFDAIVFGDVLEHLLDPVRVLRAVSERLTARGVIIASVPNVAHERVRMMLLEGRWDYSATGIMDNTHLHFFTRDNLVDTFSRAGLGIHRLSPIELTGEQVQIPVSPTTETAFSEHIKDRERNVFQFITLAQPSEDAATTNESYRLNQQRRILSLPPSADTSLYSIRIGEPLKRHGELFGGETQVGQFGAPTEEQLKWADTVVLQREVTDEQLLFVDHLHNLGKRVVFDIDDYLLEPPEYLSVYDHCMAMRPKLIEMLQKVDAVSASTAPLRDKLASYNRNVFLTPNYAWSSNPPIRHFDSESPDAEDDDGTAKRIRILVASSDSVRVDFLVPALQEIQERFDVELVGIGPPGEYLRSVGLKIDTAPLMSHEEFKAFTASRNNTIALIPLDSNDFNACKSAVKFFDYALAGVPCVCSGYEPYATAVQQNVTGALCPNITEHWVQAIERFISGSHSALLRSEMAAAARDQVLNHHNLNLTAVAWQQMFADTRFPAGDPVYSGPEAAEAAHTGLVQAQRETLGRTKIQLATGTLRHLLQPASWSSAWQIYKKDGLKGLKAKWKLVF